jgi:ATP-dependent helicase/nuclease subunit B
MLTLILGRGKSGKTTRLLRAVQECPASGMAQRILIVPEQLSHQTERALSAMCGDSISFVSEVLSFTRLASRVSAMYGGGAKATLDKGGRILTARLALTSIHAQLKVFASAAGRADFLTSMVQMIDEFKTYGVTAERLMEASQETEGFFAQKLQELSLILGAYGAVMAQGVCDPRDKLTLLRDKLLNTEYAENRYFFVDGFTDFSAQELSVLDALLRRGVHMTVTVPCDSLDSSDRLFAPGRETALRLLQLARSAGHETEILICDHRRSLPSALDHLEQHLYAYPAPPLESDCAGIGLTVAADRMEECRHCVSQLRKKAIQGRRWRDMAVAVGDTSVYGPLMEALCRDYGVPLYTGMKTPVTAHPAIAFLLCALEAVTEGMETETVTAYFRTGFSGIGPDDCDALENYSFIWNIRGSRWQNPWTEHPEGYDQTFTEETQAELDRLNALRNQAISPLTHLSAGLRNAGNTRSQLEAIYRFLEEAALFSQVQQSVSDLTQAGQLEEAQETAQIWNTLMECLGQVVSVLGETAQSGTELLKLLRLALSQYELATIPASLDAVSFGTVDAVRGTEPKVLFVLGLNEGAIPAGAAGGSLLTERERGILLDQLQIELAPDGEAAMERQLLQIYAAFTAPTDRLQVSYSQSSAGEALAPSFLVERLKALFPALVPEIPSEVQDAMTPDSLAQLYLISAQPALQASIRKAAQQAPDLEQTIITAQSASLPRQLIVSKDLTGRLFGSPVVLTASRLDKLGNCPLDFFLRYGLKAQPRKQAAFDAAEFGNFLHYILEHTVGQLPQDQPLRPEESQALVDAQMGSYLDTRLQLTAAMTPREQYLYRRNGQEVTLLLTDISQELAQSAFQPCAYELQFGREQKLEVQGTLGTGRLDGKVDRADLWRSDQGDYLRIVDYKSGTKKFDYTELYGGVGMQMLLYLFALEGSGIQDVTQQPVPAGVLYYPAKRAVLSAEQPMTQDEAEKLRRSKGGGKRSGLVLAEESVLQAMEAGDTNQYLPVQRTKSGLGDYAITPKQMELLKNFVSRRMAQAVDQVFSGDFGPDPFYRGPTHDPCKWCDYGDVCQKDQKFRRSHYHPSLTVKEFWELIGGDDNG